MGDPLVVIGAGGHGREMLDLLAAVDPHGQAYELLGVLDDGQPHLELLRRLGTTHLGPIERLDQMTREVRYVLGIGSGAARQRLATWAADRCRRGVTLVHPAAYVGRDVRLEEGVVVCAQASVTTNVTLGRHAHVNVASSVAHDVTIGAFCTIAPGARLSGNVRLDDGVTVGSGAILLPGVRLGCDSVVGAGAVVTGDVAAGVTVVGVPARPVGNSTPSPDRPFSRTEDPPK